MADSNRFIWFYKWIVGRRTLDQLVLESGYSKPTLQRYFASCLCRQPKLSVHAEQINLLFDGTYFSWDLCLVLYRDNTVKFTQFYRLTNVEKYEELKEDLENLLSLGMNIESITYDGHRTLSKAIHVICPNITLQRCIIYMCSEFAGYGSPIRQRALPVKS